MGVKGGSIRTVEELDETLATLARDALIEPAPVQPSRGVAYVVTAKGKSGDDLHDCALLQRDPEPAQARPRFPCSDRRAGGFDHRQDSRAG